MAAHHGARRHQQLAGGHRARIDARRRHAARGHPGTATGRRGPRRVEHTRRAGLDAERARQHGEIGGQQRVGAGRQPRHAGADGDALAVRGHGGVLGGRRIVAAEAGHDGIDGAAGLAETEAGIGVGHGVLEHVHRTAASAHERGAGQFAAAGQVQQRAGVGRDGLHVDLDHAGRRAVQVIAAHARDPDLLSAVQVLDTVGGAAIGHYQPLAADRGYAAGQETHAGRRALGPHEDNRAERRVHHAALDDIGPRQRHRAEGGIRHVGHALRGAPDRQHRIRILQRIAAPLPVVFARRNPAAAAGGGIDLGRGDGQAVGRGQQRVAIEVLAHGHARQAQVAGQVDLDVIEAAQVAHAAQIHHAGVQHQAMPALEPVRRHHADLHHAVGSQRRRVGRVIQEQVGGRQGHHAALGRALAQHQRTRQAQALGHGQRQAAVGPYRREQRQVAEAAGLDLVHAQAAGAIAQVGARLARTQAGGQQRGPLLPRQRQDARRQHRGLGQVPLVESRRQRHAQRSARRARPARHGAQVAVQVQAVGRRQHDAAAVVGQQRGAAPGQVHQRLRARRVQQRAGAQDQVPVHRPARGVGIGLPVQRAADLDAAARARHAIAAAVGGQRDVAVARHVQHAFLADPHRAAVGLGRVVLLRVHPSVQDRDQAAGRHQAAQHRDLVAAGKADRLARIHRHPRARADLQHAAKGVAVRAQRQAGAATLGQPAALGIFRVQRRGPQQQGLGRVAARERQRAAFPTHAPYRHGDGDIRAIGDPQAAMAVEVIAGKAGLEQGRIQPHRIGRQAIGGAAQHEGAAAGQAEGAAAAHAVTAHRAGQRHLAAGGRLRADGVGFQRHAAAAPALQRATGQQRRARRHIDQAARRQRHVARAAQRHAAAVNDGQAALRGRILLQVAPHAARIQHDAAGHAQRGLGIIGRQQRNIFEPAGRARLAQRVARLDQAAAADQIRIDVDSRRIERDLAAVGAAQAGVHAHGPGGRQTDGAQAEPVQAVGVQEHLALHLGGQRIGQFESRGAARQIPAHHHLGGRAAGAELVAQEVAGVVVIRLVGAHHELRCARRVAVRLAVAVLAGHRRARLAVALVSVADDVAIEHRVAGRDHQRAGVAAHGVARFVARRRRDQRVVEAPRGVLAPAPRHRLVAPVQAAVEQIARRAVGQVQAAVLAAQPALADLAALHVERAARQVDGRAGLRHHLGAIEAHHAALRQPVAHRHAERAQVTAHFQQPAGRVPAVGIVAAAARRQAHQVAPVEPHLAVVQQLAVAVDRGVALFVALQVDLEVVGLHRHDHADRAAHVDARAVAHQRAAIGLDRHLPAGGQRQRTALEVHRALAADAQQRQVATEFVAGDQRGVAAHGRLQQARALAVQRGRQAGVHQDGADRAIGQRHRRAVAARVQMNGAARIHRGARHQHAGLLHALRGQGHIALRRLDQPGVAHQAGAGRLRLVAARGGGDVAVRALPAADDEAVAGRQQRLALRRADLAGVADFLAGQQHVAAAARGAAGRGRGQARAGLHLDLAERVLESGNGAVGVGVDAALAELRVAHGGGGHHQVARVDLAGATEDHAVLVHHQHRAVGLDRTLDLARPRRCAHHPVQHRVVGLLLEPQRGVAAHVEGVPVQDGARLRLLDRHQLSAAVGAGGRLVGALPFGLRALGDPQAARREPVRHGRAIGRRGSARRRLRRLLRGHRRRRAIQVVQRALQLLARLRLLAGAVADASQTAVGHAAGALRGRLHRALVGEPTRTEGARLGLRRPAPTARHQQHRQCLRHRRQAPGGTARTPRGSAGDKGVTTAGHDGFSFEESDLASAAPGPVRLEEGDAGRAILRMGA
ncbi:hypothetical protein LMG26840_05712 [Achromobacter dolens]|nr:hypothetical protein LMG26840_05712 [Achromobacter dolens]